MTIETPQQPQNTISPDGMWEWDGQNWIPTGTPQNETVVSPTPEDPKSRRGLIIGASILAAGLVVGGALAASGQDDQPTSDPVAQDQPIQGEASTAEDSAPSAATEASDASEAQVGETVQVGDWAVTITEVNTNANAAIAKANQFNEDPTGQYVLVTYTATYTGDEISGDAWMDIYFSFAGNDAVLYDEASVVTPMDSTDAPTEVRPGGTVTYQVAFDVPASAIEGGSIIVETGFGNDPVEIYL